MAGIRVIAKATDRFAKFREAKKMVRMSCDAASQREQAKLPHSTSHHTLSRLLKILIVVV